LNKRRKEGMMELKNKGDNEYIKEKILQRK